MGLINLRGSIVTVLDLGIRLGGNAVDVERGSIVLVDHGSRVVGLAVDELRDVQRVWRSSIEPADADAEQEGFVRGMLRAAGEVAALLDVSRIVADALGSATYRKLSQSGVIVSHSVLICDDAIFMRTMVGDILQQAGFDIVGEAETGLQAVEKYKQLRPDLVTMDIVMPDMGGIDAVREITKFDPQAKILMCSAMGQQALVVEAIQAGARDFVVKPFQPSRVLEAVQRVLG